MTRACQDPAMPTFRFENHVSGHLFRWLISSGEIDWTAMIERACLEDNHREKAMKRIAKAIKRTIKEHEGWDVVAKRLSENPPTGIAFPVEPAATNQAAAETDRPVAPPYRIWFRPSPSKKIRFEEVARGLLDFAGCQTAGP